ncbi:electron transfer flavoprotein subunit beta/FixA family protein [Verrucomicrobiota bacterium]
MHIAVCIKQVPDTDKVTIDRETNRLNRAGVPSVLNPFDENALELALHLKDTQGAKVTVITMGPPQAEEMLRRTLALGADDAVLVSDPKLGGSDTWATSLALAATIKKLGPVDLVLFGKQAIDGDTAQVGPETAVFLDLPIVTYIKQLDKTDDGYRVTQVTDNGYDVWDVDSPAAFTVVKDANILRLITLRGKLEANKREIRQFNLADLGLEPAQTGLKGSPTKVSKIFTPPVKHARMKLEGSPSEMAEGLFGNLKERGLL